MKKISSKTETRTYPDEIGLHNLKAPVGSHKKRKILGRGPSSGHGKTSTRGSKGQTSRSGRDMYPGFEGGQTPLIRRVPKRGFVNKFKKEYQIVNIERFKEILPLPMRGQSLPLTPRGRDDQAGSSQKNSPHGQLITPQVLENNGLIKNKNKLIKILGDGEIKTVLTVQAHAFSRKAQEKITAAGGSFEVLNPALLVKDSASGNQKNGGIDA